MNYRPPRPHLLSGSRWRGKKIGILGGSFNPAHSGHMHIALSALKKGHFHAIWWIVSPQNPLKQKKNNFQKRFTNTQRFVSHPKMVVCDIEKTFQTQYSLQTIQKLQRYFPKTKFTWIAGMDNATIFHHWDGWTKILKKMPFMFFNRPGARMSVSRNPIRRYHGQKRVHFYLTGKSQNISSTQIRKKRFAKFLKPDVY